MAHEMTAGEVIRQARERGYNRAVAAAERPIDYQRMQREFPKQKAALTRALKQKDYAKRVDAVVLTCRKTVKAWDEVGAWPDDWSRWQRALDDSLGWGRSIRLEDLR